MGKHTSKVSLEDLMSEKHICLLAFAGFLADMPPFPILYLIPASCSHWLKSWLTQPRVLQAEQGEVSKLSSDLALPERYICLILLCLEEKQVLSSVMNTFIFLSCFSSVQVYPACLCFQYTMLYGLATGKDIFYYKWVC